MHSLQIFPKWALQKTFPQRDVANIEPASIGRSSSSSIPLKWEETAIPWWCFCFLGQLNEYLLVILIITLKNVSFLSNGYKIQNRFPPQPTSNCIIHRKITSEISEGDFGWVLVGGHYTVKLKWLFWIEFCFGETRF